MEPGFFRSLFDISFTRFITTRIIKFVYVVTLAVVALIALIFVIGAFRQSAGLGIAMLFVGAPLASLFYVVYARLVLEFIVQVFRITELLRDQNELQRAAFSAAGWLPTDVAVTPAVEPTPVAPAAEPMPVAQCPQCGAVPSPGAAFCRSCGHRLA
jgi:uncharacterized membrane protein